MSEMIYRTKRGAGYSRVATMGIVTRFDYGIPTTQRA